MTTKISVISPEYKGAAMVSELVRRIKESVTPISEDFEIILVNDASPDNTWTEIEKVCKEDIRVKGINLSRNFGQHYAISAGLQHAKGEWIIVMDCDLQDRPEEIPNLYNKALEGYDIVYAQASRWKMFTTTTAWLSRPAPSILNASTDTFTPPTSPISLSAIHTISAWPKTVRLAS